MSIQYGSFLLLTNKEPYILYKDQKGQNKVNIS